MKSEFPWVLEDVEFKCHILSSGNVCEIAVMYYLLLLLLLLLGYTLSMP
jgi:hypothetical protein